MKKSAVIFPLQNVWPSFTQLLLYFLTLNFLTSCNNYKKINPQRKEIIEAVYASGRMVAENEHSLYASQTGTIISKLVNEGDTVTTGQLLYIIKKENLQTTAQVSTNPVINALLADNSSSPGSAGSNKWYIKSDCDCIVYQAAKEIGQIVRQADNMVLLGGKDNQLAQLWVDQSDIIRIKIGQQILLKSDLTGDTIYEAEVKNISPVMNEANQTFKIEAVVKTPLNSKFLHNSVEGNILVQKKKMALVLPPYAVQEGDSVFIEKADGIQKIKITTGMRDNSFIEVLNGLDEKTIVIIKNKK